jgi:hypothetical protein
MSHTGRTPWDHPGGSRWLERAIKGIVLWSVETGVLYYKELDTVKLNRIIAVGLAVALMTGALLAEEKTALKSGPQAGEELAGPFHPLNVTGSKAGEKACLYCSNGSNPVAMIFAREPNAQLGKLLKKIDAACEKNTSAKLNSFVVFCS